MLAAEKFSIAKRFDGDTLLLSPSLFYTKKKAFVKLKSEQKRSTVPCVVSLVVS